MNQLSTQKTMTVKEVAEALGIDPRTVQMKVKELFPEIVAERKTTYLTEEQVTAVKLGCEKKFAVQTNLEKVLAIKQGYELLMEQVDNLHAEIRIMKPKAALADQAIRDESKQYSITDAGKHLDLRQSNIFALMRSKGLLTTKRLPTQKAIDQGILVLKTNVVDGKNRDQAVMTMENIHNFKQRYLKEK